MCLIFMFVFKLRLFSILQYQIVVEEIIDVKNFQDRSVTKVNRCRSAVV